MLITKKFAKISLYIAFFLHLCYTDYNNPMEGVLSSALARLIWVEKCKRHIEIYSMYHLKGEMNYGISTHALSGRQDEGGYTQL